MIIKQYIGWDCGSKKLARTIINIDDNFKMSIIRNGFDLCDGNKVKDVDVITRFRRLKEIVESTPYHENCIVFVERQPPRKPTFTKKSQFRVSGITQNMEIEFALLALQCDKRIVRVNPTLKSKLFIDPQKGIFKLDKMFSGDHKKYAVKNTIAFFKYCGIEYTVDNPIYEIDIADSTMTIIAGLIFTKVYI